MLPAWLATMACGPAGAGGADAPDRDGDGFLAPGEGVPAAEADCDDADPAVHPGTARLVPAGDFVQGDDLAAGAGPRRDVRLSAYCIDVREVSSTAFAAFLREDISLRVEDGLVYDGDGALLYDLVDAEADDAIAEHIAADGFAVDPAYADHPVNEVTWFGAAAYCAWAGGALPTEAQWERAARGDDARTFPWGEAEPTCDLANFGTDVGSQEPPCVGDTEAVGSHPEGASPFGVEDAAGNVLEWVADYYVAGYPTEAPAVDPLGPAYGWSDDPLWSGSDARVVRGGGWITGPDALAAYARWSDWPLHTSNTIGFRCARAVP